ncbi:glycosyltransferase [Arthrobacter sp. zg-Y238]|uniref:glycosyltransferase n=1 Tax=Arthrobacter sp. zg-Y238 TaxID=2964614 RepID=UPI002103F1B4|nr:glycosyltransferase [Arthrobacter sp. zg-Y238]
MTVTYNNSSVLKRYWDNLEWPAGVEWIVVDNASSDDSVAVAEALGARVIALPKNCGFGAANNVGFDHASGDYVAFVNPDVTVDFGSLDILREVIDTANALVAPQLTNDDGTLQANGRGLPFLLHKIRHRLEPSSLDEQYRLFSNDGEDREVSWFIGAVVAGTKETFAKLGPWDPAFFLYYEDADICLRAKKMGHKSIVCGSARWVHGWQRETTSFRFVPWKRELASMAKFYSRYPALLSLFPSGTAKKLRATEEARSCV